jgi:hypothetical protein
MTIQLYRLRRSYGRVDVHWGVQLNSKYGSVWCPPPTVADAARKQLYKSTHPTMEQSHFPVPHTHDVVAQAVGKGCRRDVYYTGWIPLVGDGDAQAHGCRVYLPVVMVKTVGSKGHQSGQ